MITTDELVQAIRAEAAEFPDMVYRRTAPPPGTFGTARCEYHPDDLNPRGCIVGAGLRRAGVPEERLVPGMMAWSAVRERVRGFGASELIPVIEELDDLVEPKAFANRWIATVQSAQDGGSTWAAAVETADQRYPEVDA